MSNDSFEGQAGWSLALTPILILLLALLVYFFGWTTLVVVLAVVVAIALGTYIYDTVQNKARSGRCPSCGEKALRSHMDKAVAEGMKNGLLVNPAWFWMQCERCGARFKGRRYDRTLQAVTDQEWEVSVAPTRK